MGAGKKHGGAGRGAGERHMQGMVGHTTTAVGSGEDHLPRRMPITWGKEALLPHPAKFRPFSLIQHACVCGGLIGLRVGNGSLSSRNTPGVGWGSKSMCTINMWSNRQAGPMPGWQAPLQPPSSHGVGVGQEERRRVGRVTGGAVGARERSSTVPPWVGVNGVINTLQAVAGTGTPTGNAWFRGREQGSAGGRGFQEPHIVTVWWQAGR